jgi:D-arginine dehydrogenase
MSGVRGQLPSETGFVIIGAGVAGAVTAWALARAKHGPGLVLEQEAAPGMHASGRNAGIAHQLEHDPVILTLAVRGMERLRDLDAGRGELLSGAGGLLVVGKARENSLAVIHERMREAGIQSELMASAPARSRFGCLNLAVFDTALWCPSDGVLDIHALLMRYLDDARTGGFALRTGCRVDDLLIEGGRVRGVRVAGQTIRAGAVVDASGAWAGRLGRAAARLPLRPMRRHLFVTGPLPFVDRAWPPTWAIDREFYFRPESDGLLLSPCDEADAEPGLPPTDPAAATLLAEKLAVCAPALADVTIRRSWAGLRTFAADRHPIIGPDPDLPGLFHVGALGGFGMTTGAAIGELAATLLTGGRPDWIDPEIVAPSRLLLNGKSPRAASARSAG